MFVTMGADSSRGIWTHILGPTSCSPYRMGQKTCGTPHPHPLGVPEPTFHSFPDQTPRGKRKNSPHLCACWPPALVAKVACRLEGSRQPNPNLATLPLPPARGWRPPQVPPSHTHGQCCPRGTPAAPGHSSGNRHALIWRTSDPWLGSPVVQPSAARAQELGSVPSEKLQFGGTPEIASPECAVQAEEGLGTGKWHSRAPRVTKRWVACRRRVVLQAVTLVRRLREGFQF